MPDRATKVSLMRVAALYDIHGNLPALEAVLAEIHQADVDRVVVGGDVVEGPMPRETIARLLELDRPTEFIQGNGDREVVARIRGIETGTVPEKFRDVMAWVAGQLPREHEQLLATWPKAVRVSGLQLADSVRTMNKNRNRKNQPPTVVGKHQPRNAKPKLAKRSEVVQAARNHPELNLSTGEDEVAYRERPARQSKAGR